MTSFSRRTRPMIPRYSRPEMSRLWTDEYRFEKMLRSGNSCLRGVGAAGQSPRARAGYQPAQSGRTSVESARSKKWSSTMSSPLSPRSVKARPGRAVLAHGADFLRRAGYRARGPDGRGGEYLTGGHGLLRRTVAALARRHLDTLMIGRSHGIHGEPITFGVKAAGWYAKSAAPSAA